MWYARREAVEGRFHFEMELPAAASSLNAAGRTLVGRKYLLAEDAFVFAGALERWCHTIDLMLIEFAYPETTTLYDDWEELNPPGTSDRGVPLFLGMA
jgi:hypothetical protein